KRLLCNLFILSLLYLFVHPSFLLSFPTRRSSDLTVCSLGGCSGCKLLWFVGVAGASQQLHDLQTDGGDFRTHGVARMGAGYLPLPDQLAWLAADQQDAISDGQCFVDVMGDQHR